MVAPHVLRVRFEPQAMNGAIYILDEGGRRITLEAIRAACQYRMWGLLAVHVRSTHVHNVVEIASDPREAAADFKEYSSRALNRSSAADADRKKWARGMSTGD